MRVSKWVLAIGVILMGLGGSSSLGGVIYTSDFSSDPNWRTDQPGNFCWDGNAMEYAVSVINHHELYHPSRYAYGLTTYSGGSFSLSWDQEMTRCDWSAGVNFGLYASDMQYDGYPLVGGPKPVSTVNLEYFNAGGGSNLFLRATDANGNNKNAYGDPNHYNLNSWYHNVLTYDSVAGTVTAIVTDANTGMVVARLSVSGLGPFSADMTRVGVTRYPFGETGYGGVSEYAVAEGRIDNISFVPEPATLTLLCLAGLALVRRRRRTVGSW